MVLAVGVEGVGGFPGVGQAVVVCVSTGGAGGEVGVASDLGRVVDEAAGGVVDVVDDSGVG